MAKPVYALVGPEPFLQLQRLTEIVKQMPPDVQRIDIDGETAELADVLDELRSFSMFGGAKLVVVRDAEEFLTRFRSQLENYVESPSSGSTLVLRLNALPATQRIHKAISKVGAVEKCDPPTAANLGRWIADRGTRVHGVTIAPDAVKLLQELIGCDLGRLDTELAKLALHAEGGVVSAKQISGIVSFQREQEMYDMTIELATGNPGEALRRWRQLLQMTTSAEFRAVTWLAMWLEDVGLVVRGGQVNTWKYKERLPAFMKVARSLGKQGYVRALDLLAELDYQIKTGVGDAAGNVERFILAVAPGSDASR